MEVEVSRRRFLQGSVALSILGAVGVSSASELVKENKDKKLKFKVVPTVCEMCVNKCTAYAKVENGVVKKLDPNPHFPKSKNMLCARGDAGIHALYDPDRLKYPLVRIGPKGSGKFKRVSWDEAYEAILNGTKHFKGLKQILDEEKDNRSTIGYCAGEGMAEHTYKILMQDMLGSSNFINHASICLQTTVSGYALTIGGYGQADLENAKYIIMAGANRAEAIVTPDTMDLFKRTRGRGAKLIVVDPRYTYTAAHADEWLGINVGTDLAFVLALTYVVLKEQLYNVEFVEKNFDGFEEYKNHILSNNYTPQWAEQITGIKAQKIEKIAREFMDNAPQAVYYQGRRTAWSLQDFQLRRAQAIFTALGGGIDVKGGIVFGKKLPLGEHEINTPMYANAQERIDVNEAKLVGATGTWIGWRNMVAEGKTPYPIRAFFVYKQNPMLSVPNIAKTKKMLEKMDLVVTIDTMPSDTVIMSDVVLPECTYLEREDPVKSFGGVQPAIVLRQKVIDPLYDTKPMIEIARGLAQKLEKPLFEITKKYDEDVQDEIEDRSEEEVFEEDGFKISEPFMKSQEEINRHMVESVYGQKAWETLKEKGVFYPNMDKFFKKLGNNEYQYYPEDKKYYSVLKLGEKFDMDSCVNPKFISWLKKGFKTSSQKITCNLKSFKDKGIDPMPTWNDKAYKKAPKGQFRFITGRHAYFTQDATQNNAMLLDLMNENYLWINAEDAKEFGIKFGELVEVESKVGKVKVKAYPTYKIIKGTVFFVHGFGASSNGLTLAQNNGASDNAIIEDIIEPVLGSAAMHETIVKLKKVAS